jgi:type VI secretion system protein ImpA
VFIRNRRPFLSGGNNVIDLSLWLSPLDGPNPSGADLRDSDLFHEIERLTEIPRDERDERNKPPPRVSVPIDWSIVLQKADELRPTGRDLRLLVYVARALFHREGILGLAAGIDLISKSLDIYWDSIHPALRIGASPQEAAVRRLNALSQLQNTSDGLLRDLRKTIYLTPRGYGQVSGDDLEQGMLSEHSKLSAAPTGMSVAEKAALIAAHEKLVDRVRKGCADQSTEAPATMAALIGGIYETLTALATLDKVMNDRLGTERSVAPDLGKALKAMLATLERPRTANGKAGDPQQQIAATSNSPPPVALNGQGASSGGVSAESTWHGLPDRLGSRDDVVKCLDLVIAFYDRTEPSSPIPHLARRIRRMVPMDFLDLMEDLAPSGLKEFRLLAGVPDQKKSSQKEER